MTQIKNSAERKKRYKNILSNTPDKYKQLVKKIIKFSPIWGAHQTIQFPDGWTLRGGRDESRIEMMGLPLDLSGFSVLDIGCNIGGICIECKKRNAEKVLGVDRSKGLIECAKDIAVILRLNIEYKELDVVKNSITEKFDYVFMLNVFHHLSEKNKIAVLRLLDSITSKKLFFEAPIERDIVASPHKTLKTEDYLSYLQGFTNFSNINVVAHTDFNRPLISCER